LFGELHIPTCPQRPDSPDISRFDFFLFGDLKAKLKGEELETMSELQGQAEELHGQVTSDTMRRVYEHWIERLNQVIHTDGDYI
jgi:hypothetical protein